MRYELKLSKNAWHNHIQFVLRVTHKRTNKHVKFLLWDFFFFAEGLYARTSINANLDIFYLLFIFETKVIYTSAFMF